MQGKPKRQRQKRCKCCEELFQLDTRTKGKQLYCSKPECQAIRQRKNEKDWRKRNPDCVEYQYQQTRQWNSIHSDYSHQRRAQNPQLLKHNRAQTRNRMQKIRTKRVFDKSKSIVKTRIYWRESKHVQTGGQPIAKKQAL